MGVPALFRWLNNKYPKITAQVIEEKSSGSDKYTLRGPPLSPGDGDLHSSGAHGPTDVPHPPIDTSRPNPNGFELDNLYLDMNGIIHPCCHPEGKEAPATEDDMFLEIFSYIDRIFGMVRPRRLLYMAIDGVAPRAKMNQQRSRRFRAAQEAKEKADSAAELREQLRANGVLLQEDSDAVLGTPFDSNCITPGTKFMYNLSLALKYYIIRRLNEDPGWANIQVILSDASVPGEGEHKIMEFIRHQRASPSHDPNEQHVMYGLDADLIMLALATHQVHFRVLREDVFFEEAKNKDSCYRCGNQGHHATECISGDAPVAGAKLPSGTSHSEKPFIFLNIPVLREYLFFEFSFNFPGGFNFENMIDDWIFLIFFVGNDFLPHLPSMEIREGAIDLLLDVYKKIFRTKLNSRYLTHKGNVDAEKVLTLLQEVGRLEDKIFIKRKEREERQLSNKLRQQKAGKASLEVAHHVKGHVTESSPPIPTGEPETADLSAPNGSNASGNTFVPKANKLRTSIDLEPTALKHQYFDPNSKTHSSRLQRDQEKGTCPPKKSKLSEETCQESANNDCAEEDDNTNDPDPTTTTDIQAKTKCTSKSLEQIVDEDIVPLDNASRKENAADGTDPTIELRLWESGAGERYYQEKFKHSSSDASFVSNVVMSYLQGLSWVMIYYYRGCASWTWFYPYHYAPFASDFSVLDPKTAHLEPFSKGAPFKPFEQLLGVLPAASSSLLPEPYEKLMCGQSSSIADFYPETFPIDLNGKKHAWQGVALLPFIDENRLLAASSSVPSEDVCPEDQLRNTFGYDYLFVSESQPTFDTLGKELYASFAENPKIHLESRPASISGIIAKDPDVCLPGSTYWPCLESLSKIAPQVAGNTSLSCFYANPFSEDGSEQLCFPPALLPGSVIPRPIVTFDDFRTSKFSKQTVRGTYHSSLLRSSDFHSMHKEYDDKTELLSRQQYEHYSQTHSNNGDNVGPRDGERHEASSFYRGERPRQYSSDSSYRGGSSNFNPAQHRFNGGAYPSYPGTYYNSSQPVGPFHSAYNPHGQQHNPYFSYTSIQQQQQQQLPTQGHQNNQNDRNQGRRQHSQSHTNPYAYSHYEKRHR